MTQPTQAPLHLDDFTVGDVFTSDEHTIDEQQIVEFARQFDRQPFHLDPDAAKNTFFRGLAASGWHTAAITMRLLTGGAVPIAGGIVGAGGEIAWPTPTRPGDVLHVESTAVGVTPSRSKPDRGIVTLRSETKTADGEVRQVSTMGLLAFRKAD